MKSTDFIKEAPVQYSTTFRGAPESHPMYNTYYQQELAKRKNLPSGEETAKIMAANRVKADMAKAGTTAFPVALGQQQSLSQFQQAAMDQATQAMNTPAAKPLMTGSKTDPRNPTPHVGPTIPQPAPVAQTTLVKPAANMQSTSTVSDETDDMRGGQSQNTSLPAGGMTSTGNRTAAQPSATNPATVGADPMRPVAQPQTTTTTPQYAGSKGAQAIMALNPDKIKDVNKIRVGDQIKLPDGSTYTIAKGDTLDAIASGRGKGQAAQSSTPASNLNDPRQGRGMRTSSTTPQATLAGVPKQQVKPMPTTPSTPTTPNSPTARSPGMKLPRPGGPMPRDIPREPGPLSPQMPPSASAVQPRASMQQALDAQTGKGVQWAPNPVPPGATATPINLPPGTQVSQGIVAPDSPMATGQLPSSVSQAAQNLIKPRPAVVKQSLDKSTTNLIIESLTPVEQIQFFKSVLTEAPKSDIPAYVRQGPAFDPNPDWKVSLNDLEAENPSKARAAQGNQRFSPNATGDAGRYSQSGSAAQPAQQPRSSVSAGRVEPKIPQQSLSPDQLKQVAQRSAAEPETGRAFKQKGSMFNQAEATKLKNLISSGNVADDAIRAGMRSGAERGFGAISRGIQSAASAGPIRQASRGILGTTARFLGGGLVGWAAIEAVAALADYVYDLYKNSKILYNSQPNSPTKEQDVAENENDYRAIAPYLAPDKFQTLSKEEQDLVIRAAEAYAKKTGKKIDYPPTPLPTR